MYKKIINSFNIDVALLPFKLDTAQVRCSDFGQFDIEGDCKKEKNKKELRKNF
jgi:hypothetical protein